MVHTKVDSTRQAHAAVTKWAIEYEVPAAEAFRLNHPGAATFTDNCNVILACAMANDGLQADCRASPEVPDPSLLKLHSKS